MLLIPVKSCVCNRLLNNRVLTLEVGVESVFLGAGSGRKGGGEREEALRRVTRDSSVVIKNK